MFSKFRLSSKFVFLIKNKNKTCIRFLQSVTDFTKNNYKITRGNFNEIKENDINFFKGLLTENRVITDAADLDKYNLDWFNYVRGCSSVVLKPKTTEEASKVLSYCNQNKLAVCFQGGNTGVVGGAVSVFDEIVISTELMNNIIKTDDTSGVMVCQAGCILEDLDNHLAEKGLMVPLDLGAKGSCHIGGNVSTNAGGLRMLRYGNLHGNVLGLEVVKANGDVLDLLGTHKKDNTGYHLKHLFIGSEGTLGFVTKVALQCPPKPKHINVAFLGLQNFEKVIKTFKTVKQDLGEILSAVEVIDRKSMELIDEKLNLKSPIGDYPFYLLIETSGSNGAHDSEKLTTFLETSLNKHLILNGTVATDPNKIKAIWALRERIPEAYKFCGALICYDVSLPINNYFTLVDDVDKHMGNLAERVFGFGHLGDGNLHVEIQLNAYSKEIKDYLEPYVMKRTIELKGSISAEHGMGFLKAEYLSLARPQSTVALMKDLKHYFDPNGILNPYKVFSS